MSKSNGKKRVSTASSASIDPATIKKAKNLAQLPEQKQRQFVEGYNRLVKETGYQLASQPALKPMGDLGGFLVSSQLVIIPVPPEKRE